MYVINVVNRMRYGFVCMLLLHRTYIPRKGSLVIFCVSRYVLTCTILLIKYTLYTTARSYIKQGTYVPVITREYNIFIYIYVIVPLYTYMRECKRRANKTDHLGWVHILYTPRIT